MKVHLTWLLVAAVCGALAGRAVTLAYTPPPKPCPLLPGEFGCDGFCVGTSENTTCLWRNDYENRYQLRPCPNVYITSGARREVSAHGNVFQYDTVVVVKR